MNLDLMGIFIPFFCAFAVLLLVSWLVVSGADEDRKAVETDGGEVKFFPNRRAYWGVYIFLGFLGYVVLMSLIGAFHSIASLLPALVCLGFVALILRAFPGAIVSDASGIEQVFWLPVRKRIAWDEVAAITVNQKKREICIRGRNGAKVLHSRQLPDRDRLVEELKLRCPAKLPAELTPKAMSI